MDKQREQFEAWAKGQYTINKDDAGEYWNGFTQDAWLAWRAAQSAKALDFRQFRDLVGFAILMAINLPESDPRRDFIRQANEFISLTDSKA